MNRNMKTIITSVILLVTLCATAQNDPGFFQPVARISDQPGIFFSGISGTIDCESETITGQWESNDKPVKCDHKWVYAEYSEVNANFSTDAVYCPCGCDSEHIEARICSICLRHERRVITTLYREKVSEYQHLLNKKKHE